MSTIVDNKFTRAVNQEIRKEVTIYTDGACSPNPGKGGYGVVIYDDNNNLIDCYSHYENNTTNNIQEIKAILYTFLNYGIKLKGATRPLYSYLVTIQSQTRKSFGFPRCGFSPNELIQKTILECEHSS